MNAEMPYRILALRCECADFFHDLVRLRNGVKIYHPGRTEEKHRGSKRLICRFRCRIAVFKICFAAADHPGTHCRGGGGGIESETADLQFVFAVERQGNVGTLRREIHAQNFAVFDRFDGEDPVAEVAAAFAPAGTYGNFLFLDGGNFKLHPVILTGLKPIVKIGLYEVQLAGGDQVDTIGGGIFNRG